MGVKEIKVKILSKGRKFYKAQLVSGYPCKIEIGDNELEVANAFVSLFVEDISIRSNYGVDLRYKSICTCENNSFIFLKPERFNIRVKTRAKDLGGQWDPQEKVWAFRSIVEQEVEELDEMYNSNFIPVEIKVLEDIEEERDAFVVAGFPLVEAKGRDSGAECCEEVAFISGKITSGGSVKNWTTKVSKGTILRTTLPRMVVEEELKNSQEVQISILK